MTDEVNDCITIRYHYYYMWWTHGACSCTCTLTCNFKITPFYTLYIHVLTNGRREGRMEGEKGSTCKEGEKGREEKGREGRRERERDFYFW